MSQINDKRLLIDLKINISAKYADQKFSLNGINSIKGFFKDQLEFWSDNQELNFRIFNEFITHFRNCYKKIEEFIDQSEGLNDDDFKRNWKAVLSELQRNQTAGGNYPIIYSKTPHASFLVELVEEDSEYGIGAYNYIFNKNTNIQNSKKLFIGYLRAYEFDMQSVSKIKKRRHNERISLGKIRSKWIDKTNSLQEEFDTTTSNFDEKTKFLVDRADRWTRLKIKDINRTFENLEASYSDKLKLEKPVVYWQDLAEDYKKSGYWWVGFLSVSSLVMAVILLILFYIPPESFSSDLTSGDPIAIKNVILFATLISVMAFLVKTFSKMALSSFHLRRDSREREQLTLVYLALLKGGAISNKERDLILEAIFNRSDTGLIRSDGKENSIISYYPKKFNSGE